MILTHKLIENNIEYVMEIVTEPDRSYIPGKYYYDKNYKYLDRENGPAMMYSDGTKIWFKNDMWHRDNGPALVKKDGTKNYWLNNKYYPDIKSDDEWIISQIIE